MTATNYAAQAQRQFTELVDVLCGALDKAGAASNVDHACDVWSAVAPESDLAEPLTPSVDVVQRRTGPTQVTS